MRLHKFNPLTSDVVFVDGLWGTGKSILAPIIGGMRGVEKQRIAEIYEYVCTLYELKLLQADAAVSLLKTYGDLHQYNNALAREVNFRWKDVSGPSNNPGGFRYLRRLFADDGEQVIDQINQTNLALHVVSHMILLMPDPLFEAFGSRLRIVELVRHPVYMVSHWTTYFTRFESTKEVTLSFYVRGQKVPWFASTWADEYLAAEPVERALLCISKLYARLFAVLDQQAERTQELLVLPFESTVLDPFPAMQRLSAFLGRPHSPRLARLMKAQKMPRRTLLDGVGWRSYGWDPSKAQLSEQEAYRGQLSEIGRKSTPDTFDLFIGTITEYNRRWPSQLASFA